MIRESPLTYGNAVMLFASNPRFGDERMTTLMDLDAALNHLSQLDPLARKLKFHFPEVRLNTIRELREHHLVVKTCGDEYVSSLVGQMGHETLPKETYSHIESFLHTRSINWSGEMNKLYAGLLHK